MATYNSALFASQSPGQGHSTNANPTPLAKNASGKERLAQVPYTLLGTEAANDLINLCQLKPGSRVISSRCSLLGQNPGTTLTISVGDASNATRYAAALTLSNAVTAQSFSVAPGTDLYTPTDIVPGSPDQTVVVAKIVTAATLTAGQKLLFLIGFVDE